MFKPKQHITVPFRPQIEARDCGAAALEMILAYFGRHVPLYKLRIACSVSREGVGVLNIVRAAQQYGLKSKAIRREHLVGVALPAVIFWNFNHFMVLEQVNADSIVVQDPSYGRRTLSHELVQQCFSGIVLTFETTSSFTHEGEAPPLIPSELYTATSLIFTAVAVLQIVPEVAVIIVILAGLFGDVMPVETTAVILLIYGVLYLLTRFVIQKGYNRGDWLAYLFSLSPMFFTRYYTYELAVRVVRSNAAAMHIRTLEQFAGLMRAILLACILLSMSPIFLPALPIPLILGWYKLRSTHIRRQHAAQHDYWKQRLRAMTSQALAGIETLKLHGREQQIIKSLKNPVNRAFSESVSREWEFRPFTTPAIVILFCFALVHLQQVNLAQGIAACMVLLLMVYHVENAVSIGETLGHLRLALMKRDDFLRESQPPVPPAADHLAVENASFGYADNAVIAEITMQVLPGVCIGIVGRSGSGKSTLLSLLAGHIKPWQGHVHLHHSCALVDGKPLLLDGTLRNNIRLFDPSIADTDVMDALRDACLTELIPRLDDFIAADSPTLSLSQLQRLDVARALIQHPEVLLLDEATRGLDVLTEARLLENLKRRGCRCVIVSHRLSAVRDCDEILVIDAGRIVQRGTPTELARQSGIYQSLMVQGTLF